MLSSAPLPYLHSSSLPLALVCSPVITLDSPPDPPVPPVKELRSTLDGKHWTGAANRKPYRRSQLSAGPSVSAGPSGPIIPVSDWVDLSRAPSKPRTTPLSVSPAVVQPRVLFPTSHTTSGDDTSSHDLTSVDILSACDELDSTVLHSPSPDDTLHHSSFINDFPPLGLTGNDIVLPSSTILDSAASVVREILSSDHQRAPALSCVVAPSASDPLRPSVTVSDPLRPSASSSAPRPHAASSASSSLAYTRTPAVDEPPPTREQFREVQRQFVALQRQLEGLVSSQAAVVQARAIEEEVEAHRRTAYESAGLHCPPRVSAGPPAAPVPRNVEYRISHKSIGYLRPADASQRPFEAIEGETYVRPLAWLAHLRTKLELRDDFQYKNQVLQVASECLVGRAAAWWTAIGQRMLNILLTDYSLVQWHLHIQVLCQSKEQSRKVALARTRRVGKEECWDYVWDKAALFEELQLRDRPTGVALISEILDGLPSTLARMCRIEFAVNPTVSDLTRELQVLVPPWKHEFEDRPREHEMRDRRRIMPTPFVPSRYEAPTRPNPDRSPILTGAALARKRS